MADNSYDLEIRRASANGYYTPDESRRYYGKYDRMGVTYHWWNLPSQIADSDHDNIVNMMLRNAENSTAPTVNYVASNAKLSYLIDPDNVAWCSGNGNPLTISVECSPHFSDGLYRKLGWLHDQLEQRYNRTLAIYGHNHWMDTSCPGNLDLDRIRREADFWKAEREQPAPAPAPTPVPPTVTVTVEDIPNKKVRLVRDTQLWDLGFTKYADAKGVKPLAAGTIIEVSAIAHHPIGSDYYLSEYSFAKGIKNGINVRDCEDYVDVVAPPTPKPEPVPQPAPEEPEPTPEPTPVPVPITKDEEQDRRLINIEAFIEMLKRYFPFLK